MLRQRTILHQKGHTFHALLLLYLVIIKPFNKPLMLVSLICNLSKYLILPYRTRMDAHDINFHTTYFSFGYVYLEKWRPLVSPFCYPFILWTLLSLFQNGRNNLTLQIFVETKNIDSFTISLILCFNFKPNNATSQNLAYYGFHITVTFRGIAILLLLYPIWTK